jgi:uncharacterized protein YkwD
MSRRLRIVVVAVAVVSALLAATTRSSAASAQAAANGYVPVTPFRVLDTRSGARVPADGTVTAAVTGAGGVPAGGVDAVVVNITVTSTVAFGFLTAYPNGSPRPNASNVVFNANQTVPNVAVVRPGPDGAIALFVGASPAHVLVDVQGYFPVGGGFTPVVAQRLLDTRGGSTAQAAGATSTIITTSAAGAPSDANAVVLNVQAVDPAGSGYLTAFPAGEPSPNASNLNYTAGKSIANLAIIKLGAAGGVSFYTAGTATHLIVDVLGFLSPSAGYTPLSPTRVMDTRTSLVIDGTEFTKSALEEGETAYLQLTGRAGIPTTASSVVMNVTVDDPTQGGYLSVFPAGVSRPNASTNNFAAGETIPNTVIAKLGDGGGVWIFNYSGSPHVIVDVLGFFEGATAPFGPIPGYLPLEPVTRPDALSLVNSVRATARVCGTATLPPADPLAWDDRLERMAREHTDDMVARNYFALSNEAGPTFESMVVRSGYRSLGTFGVVVSGVSTEAELIEFISRPLGKACAGIMTPYLTHVGIARNFNALAHTDLWTVVLEYGTANGYPPDSAASLPKQSPLGR